MEKQGVPVSVDGDQHVTCTSTPLADTPGSKPEAIDRNILDRLYEVFFGHPVSDDPVVANIQREQVIARHKRAGK